MSLDSLTLSPSLKSSLNEATARYELHVDQAASYLAGRGITREDAGSFRLGFVADPLPGHERFVGMVSIPYLTDAGTVAMKFRRIDGSEGAKYDSPPGQKTRLYNARSLANGGELAVICEGEFDVIAAVSIGITAAAGTPGTTWLEHWPRCFGDFDRVAVIADHDAKEDGSDPGMKHAKKVMATIPGAELVTPPAGCDLTDWINEHGGDAVLEALGL